MDQQRWTDMFAFYGALPLKAFVRNSSDYDSDEDTFEEALFDLIKKKFNAIKIPPSVPKPNVQLMPDPLPVMPAELYRSCIDKIKRRELFYACLTRRDILYLQVINIDEENYKCLVLARHGDCMKLDDLSLVVYFPKLPPELELLGGDLRKFDLIRAAFWSCNVWERKMFVTLDSDIYDEKEKEKIPPLGKITRKDLPHYVNCEKIGMRYSGYVERSAGYKEPGYCINQLRECLGIETKCFLSFFKKRNNQSYPASERLAELQKKLYPDSSMTKLIKAFEYFRTGDLFKAFHYANKALVLNPDNIQARVTRGTLYANFGQLAKAFIDTEDSLKLDPKHESARKQMSELLVSASNIYLAQENYLKWHEALVSAKFYNPNNREAQELLMKSRFETLPADANNPEPIKVLVLPSIEVMAAIYNRIFIKVDKARLQKEHRKRKEKRKLERQRRAELRRQRNASLMSQSQPIPTTTTIRRKVFRRPRSPGFRRPFPPRSISEADCI